MNERALGLYATRLQLPLSGIARWLRRQSRRIRGKPGGFLQPTRLPRISWTGCPNRRAPRVWEARKENGNVRLAELGILAALAAGCEPGTNLFEIGTFDGRTTLNLAMNSPATCQVFTLDLPPDEATRFPLARGEQHMVRKPMSGARYVKNRARHPEQVGRIHQLFGDSGTFDFRRYAGSCSLVFVDGSHAYDYALADTQTARQLVRPGGAIVWHDYGIWEGVTRALEELEAREHLGLRNLRGTSLVYWRAP